MDEATSALDSNTELTVISALEKFLPNATILSVAHRHSFIDSADFTIDLT